VETVSDVTHRDDALYHSFLHQLQSRFIEHIEGGKVPLFATDAANLWDVYLDNIPCDLRQHYNCHACKQFIERFGGLVTINPDGSTASVLWDAAGAPEEYTAVLPALRRVVERAKVTGIFLSQDVKWGEPITGEWHHLAVVPPVSILHRRRDLTPFQVMAEKHEEFITVSKAISEFTKGQLETALKLLRSDSLYRSEKVLGQAEWLYSLHTTRAATKNSKIKHNLTWLAVAIAPSGFCHPRASMIGSLLEDIEAGMDYDAVSRRFASKMHPLHYQRPQEAPTAGAIEAAEKLVEQLGIAASLRRRYAYLSEVEAIWKPKDSDPLPLTGGVFGHLKARGENVTEMDVPAQTMTWEKFARTVLPTAEQIEYKTKNSVTREPFVSLVTAVDLDAPPILQWDSPERRNPISWYFWNGGRTAEQYSLAPNTFHGVNAITRKPSEWFAENEHQGSGLVFIINGARDTRECDAALFPEILKGELHKVRSVIEAYSKAAKMEGLEDASAAGIALEKGHPWSCELRVTSAGQKTIYRLDRWD
jgi:hypothetical protein